MTPAEINQTIGIIALFVAMTTFFVLYAIYAPTRKQKEQSSEDRILGEQELTFEEGDSLGKYTRPLLDNFLPKMPDIPLGEERKKNLANLLIKSGNPWRLNVDEFLGLTLALGIIGVVIGAAIGALGVLPDAVPPIAVVILLAFGGATLPYSTYNTRKQNRTKEIEKQLPEALDLLTITITSGQTFEYALENVTQQLPEGLLRNEFLRVVVENQAGAPLESTLTSLSNRFESQDLESFTKSVIKANNMGSSLDKTLQGQAAAVRANYAARLDKMIAKLESTVFIVIGATMLPAFLIIFIAPTLSQIGEFLL